MNNKTGIKFDSEKPDMSLLSPFALEEIAKVMTAGKTKYGANNWRNGIVFSRLIAAVMRHLTAYQKGETKDPETGLSHIAHASCGLMMLLEFEQTAPELNDLYHCTRAFDDAKEDVLNDKTNQEILRRLSEPEVQLELPLPQTGSDFIFERD